MILTYTLISYPFKYINDLKSVLKRGCFTLFSIVGVLLQYTPVYTPILKNLLSNLLLRKIYFSHLNKWLQLKYTYHFVNAPCCQTSC